MVTERTELPLTDEESAFQSVSEDEDNIGEDNAELGGEAEEECLEDETCACGYCGHGADEPGGEGYEGIPAAGYDGGEAYSGGNGFGAVKAKGNNFSVRLISAAAMLTVAGTAVWLGGWYLAGLVGVISLGLVSEYLNLAEARGFSPNRYLVSICALTAVASYEILGDNIPVAASCCLAILIWTLFCSGLDIILNPEKHKSALADSAINALAVLYCGVLPSLLLNLRRIHIYALVFAVIICILSDVGGYAFGKTLGKSKLCPKVSPGKTWAGFWGALLCCTVFSGAFGFYCYKLNAVLQLFPLWLWALAGLLLSVAAQLGDLFESALKRDADIKDSGSIIPGHGGVLDRFDSYLFVSVFAYLFVIAGLFYLETFLSSSPM
ncbi:phosphatidate cytidylyltransferase [bacterium]|nr:phosphatidate cytidylyltransferase [bacterium]